MIDWYERVLEKGFANRLQEIEILLQSIDGVRVFEARRPSKLLTKSTAQRPASPLAALQLQKKRLGRPLRWLFARADAVFYGLAALMVALGAAGRYWSSEPEAAPPIRVIASVHGDVQPSQVPSQGPSGTAGSSTGTKTAPTGPEPPQPHMESTTRSPEEKRP